MLRIADHWHGSDLGLQRQGNEDNYFVRSPLFVVADGMGGAQSGEVASEMAVEVFEPGLTESESPADGLVRLIETANQRIHERSRAESQRAGMGTTVTAAYVGSEQVTIAHVGDSRAYLFRDGELRRLTDDHSLVEELMRQGKLTPEEASDHPQKSIITRALGPEPAVEVDRQTIPLRDGDVFLLCSDGLTSMIDEGHIAQVLVEAGALPEAGKALVSAANAAGGRDNITVVLFRVEEIEGAGAGAAREQDTSAGQAAPRADDVRTAVAMAEREATATRVPPRAPRPRAAPRTAKRRRR